MGSVGWLALGLAALALHEAVTARLRGGPMRVLWRGASLLVMVMAAAAVGPSISERLQGLANVARREGTPFVPVGDVTFGSALARQTPAEPFPGGASADAVQAWRTRVLEALRTQAGLAADEETPVALDVLQHETVDGVERSLVTFRSWDGTVVPAYLFSPPGTGRRGAVLVVAGHGEGIRATAGVVEDYQHGAALALAKHGYVTLTPELRGFGLLGVEGGASHRAVASAALVSGSSYKALAVRDLSRALTALRARPDVDPDRIAVAGTSLGGELAVLLGVLDSRVRVVLSHSYGGDVGPERLDDVMADAERQTPHGCHTIPGINRILVQEDWVRLLSPRPVLVVRGDRNTPSGARERFAPAVGEAFDAFKARDRFEFVIEPGAHEFYLEPSVRFLARWL